VDAPSSFAAAVFNGAVVPGLDKYWKDQTADQLNLLNDTGLPDSTQKLSRKGVGSKNGKCAQSFCDSLGGHLILISRVQSSPDHEVRLWVLESARPGCPPER
jgi:hypothetical protein